MLSSFFASSSLSLLISARSSVLVAPGINSFVSYSSSSSSCSSSSLLRFRGGSWILCEGRMLGAGLGESDSPLPSMIPTPRCTRRKCSLRFSFREKPCPVLRLQSLCGQNRGAFGPPCCRCTSRSCRSKPPEYVKPLIFSQPGSRQTYGRRCLSMCFLDDTLASGNFVDGDASCTYDHSHLRVKIGGLAAHSALSQYI